MKNSHYLILLGLALSFASCKKDDDPTKKEMLVGKNWVMTAATIDPSLPVGGGTTNNLYNQLPACVKDDITRLSDDGKATFDEGATKCVVSAPQTTTGTWALSLDEKTVSITEDGETTSTTIKSLTSSKFEGTYQDQIDGVTYTISATWEAK